MSSCIASTGKGVEMGQILATVLCLGMLVIFFVNHWVGLGFEYAEFLLLGALLSFFHALD